MSREDRRSSPPRPVGPALAFLVAPLTTFALVTAAASVLDQRPSSTYYQTIAFLVPSLLVTLALQGQFFRTTHVVPLGREFAEQHPHLAKSWTGAQRFADVSLLAYLATGEFAALYVLATDDSGLLPFALTAGSVTTAFVALGIVALVGTPWIEGPPAQEERT